MSKFICTVCGLEIGEDQEWTVVSLWRTNEKRCHKDGHGCAEATHARPAQLRRHTTNADGRRGPITPSGQGRR